MAVDKKKGRFYSRWKVKRDLNLVKRHNVETIIDEKGDNIPDNIDVGWREGRRIVELGHLADQLFCLPCENRLHLSDIKEEKKYGLGSYLNIACGTCSNITTVTTGKRHSVNDDERQLCFDINTKLAAAMIHAGVGETQVANILAEMNIPQPTPRTVKKREREIGKTIEKAAEISCLAELEREKENSNCSEDRGAKVILDGGWQKRGSGRTNNSMSGHLMVIGSKTRKCIDFGVAKKSCRICKTAKSKSQSTKKHDCRKNYKGSSKGMESFLAVKTLNKIQEKGLKIETVVMDDDSSTFSKIKSSISDKISKCSDTNHVMKNFTNELYKLKDKHKALTRKNISYLQKCVNYAVTQNKGNESGLKSNLEALVPHIYGIHENCHDKHWCTYHEDNVSYTNRKVPAGRYFVDKDLKQALEELILAYCREEKLRQLVNLDTSNPIENMNQMIARKAPKSLHFSESESLDYRVSAAVLQKNEGHSYLCKVNENNKLSPGKYTASRFKTLDAQREKRHERQNTIDFKRRRLALKEEKRVHEEFNENLEGVTYGINPSDNLQPEDTIEIPKPIPTPTQPTTGTGGRSIVIFDLETTGFGTFCVDNSFIFPLSRWGLCMMGWITNIEYTDKFALASGINTSIIQMAMTHAETNQTFSCYVKPKCGFIPNNITKLTGIMLCNNIMYHNGIEVNPLDIKEACQQMIQFLKQFAPVILVAHNVLFDSKVLIQNMNECSLTYDGVIDGFGDTLKLFKNECPERKTNGQNYKQEDLVRDILGKDYNAHSAIADTNELLQLVRTVYNFEEKLPVYDTESIENRIKRSSNQAKYSASYADIVEKCNLSSAASKTLATAGLSFHHIKIIHSRSGVDGLTVLFKQILSNPQKVASSISKYLS